MGPRLLPSLWWAVLAGHHVEPVPDGLRPVVRRLLARRQMQVLESAVVQGAVTPQDHRESVRVQEDVLEQSKLPSQFDDPIEEDASRMGGRVHADLRIRAIGWKARGRLVYSAPARKSPPHTVCDPP